MIVLQSGTQREENTRRVSRSALFNGDFFLNPDEIGVLLMESAIHCRREILIEQVQQGIVRRTRKVAH